MKYAESSKNKFWMAGLTVLSGLFPLASSAFAADGSGAPVIPFIWWLAPIASVLALLFAVYFYRKMMKSSEGNDTMKKIAQHVREGALAYLKRQYRVVSFVFLILFVIFVVMA